MKLYFGKQNLRDSPSVSGVIFSRQEPDSWNLLCAIFNVCKESWNTPSSWSSCCLNIVSCWRLRFGRVARLITCDCGDDFTEASCDILSRRIVFSERWDCSRDMLRWPSSPISPNTDNGTAQSRTRSSQARSAGLACRNEHQAAARCKSDKSVIFTKRWTSPGNVNCNVSIYQLTELLIQILSRIYRYSSYYIVCLRHYICETNK